MTPLISIIVPCYNQAQYLPEALDSVLAQTYENWECVIVNDGSPDNTDEVAQEYCKKDARFKYLKQENQGVSMARNNGIKMSHGEYILPLDGDDMIAPTYCEKAIKHFLEFPETKVVYCKARFCGEFDEPWNLPEYKYEDFIWNNCIFSSVVFSRKDFELTKGYNPNMRGALEDWDFLLSLITPNDVIYQIPEELFFYRKHGLSRNDPDNMAQREGRRQMVLNHMKIYEPYFANIISYKSESDRLKDELQMTMLQMTQTRLSKAYRLGKFLLHPNTSTFKALINK